MCIRDSKYDLQVFLGYMYPSEPIERAIRKTPGIVMAESWFTSGASIPAKDAREGDDSLDILSFPIIALPENSKAIDLEIVEGRNLQPGDVDAIVINTTLVEESRIRTGNTITLRFKQALTSWHVVGIAREPFLPPTAYIPQAFIDQRYPAMRTTICIALAKTDAVSMQAVKSALDNNLEQEGIRAARSRSKADFRYCLLYTSTDQAMNWLEKGYEERFNPGVLLRPGFDPLRSDSRFQNYSTRATTIWHSEFDS